MFDRTLTRSAAVDTLHAPFEGRAQNMTKVTGNLVSTIGFAASVLVIAGVAIGASACGSSSSKGSDGGNPGSSDGGTSADQACKDSAHATCDKMESCAPNNLKAAYGDVSTCETRLKAQCLDGLSAPSTGNTAKKTEACAQAFADFACTDYRDKANTPVPCLPTHGSVADGEPCQYGPQCQSGFCAIVPGDACGKCASAPRQGDSCAQLTSCGSQWTCTSDTFVCASPLPLGQACGAGQPCGAGLSCVAPGGAGTAGKCMSAGTSEGMACDRSEKTGPGCDNALGLYCNAKTKQCASTTYAGDGEACGYDSSNGTQVNCMSGECVGANAAKMQLGTCAARAKDNGACTVPDAGASAPSSGCIPTARCVASSGTMGTCRAPAAASCK
jgi:hypothetical protein